MKIIFDFDDTLFLTKDFKKVLFSELEKFGVSSEQLSNYYIHKREYFTSPRNFYYSFILDNKLNISNKELNDILTHLFSDLDKFLNQELIGVVRKFGPENCFIVSIGDKGFQMDKINSCEINELFGEIHIVGKDKNEAIKSLMSKFKGEDFIFIDNNMKNIESAKEIINTEQKLHLVHHPHELEKFKSLIK